MSNNINTNCKANWFESHPLYSIIILSIAISSFTWVIFRFIIDENKDNLYSAQIERLKTEQDILYKKIERLEREKEELVKINDYYFDWIKNTDNPLPVLKRRIEELICLSDTKQVSNLPDTINTAIANKIYFKVKKGAASINDITGLVIGVTDIDVYSQAQIQITEMNGSIIRDKIAAGYTHIFEIKEKKFRLICSKVDFYSDYVYFVIEYIVKE